MPGRPMSQGASAEKHGRNVPWPPNSHLSISGGATEVGQGNGSKKSRRSVHQALLSVLHRESTASGIGLAGAHPISAPKFLADGKT